MKPPSILQNSAWNGLSTVAGIVLLVATTPIYLRLLGEEKFGLYMLLAGIMAPFEILNAGVAQSTIRFVAEWLQAGRLRDAANILRVNLLINLVASAAAIVSLWFAAPWLATSTFKIPLALQNDAITSFRIAGIVWGLMQLSQTLSGIAIAQQDFRTNSLVTIVRLTLLYAGGLAPAYWLGTVSSLQLWSAALLIGISLFWALHAARLLGFRSIIPGFDQAAFRSSFGYSGWQMLNALSGTLTQQSDRLLLGALQGTAAVGIYGIANNAQQRIVTLCWSLFGSLMPALSATGNNTTTDGRIIHHKGWILSMVGSWIYGLFGVFAIEACIVWLGPQTGRLVGILAMSLTAVSIIGLPSALMGQFMLGKGLTRMNFLANIAFGLVTAFTSWICIKHFGIGGAVWGMLLGVVIARPPLHWILFRNHLSESGHATNQTLKLYSPVFSGLTAGGVAFLLKTSAFFTLPPMIAMAVSLLICPVVVVAGSLFIEYIPFRRKADVIQLIGSIKSVILQRSIPSLNKL